jgi:U3 small nucleolar ribonucleoprotein protein IMP3
MRKLKYHEQKLLKKVDFLTWQKEDNLREIKVLRKYHIQKREDYVKYNKLVGMITSLVSKLKTLPTNSEVRRKSTEQLLKKLYNMGLVTVESNLGKAEDITASAFCRRRLPVVMTRLKMSESVKEAVKLIEQGHVRVGPEIVTDPAFLVTRTFEDFVTWVDSSKIKRTIASYNDQLDDYDLLEGDI